MLHTKIQGGGLGNVKLDLNGLIFFVVFLTKEFYLTGIEVKVNGKQLRFFYSKRTQMCYNTSYCWERGRTQPQVHTATGSCIRQQCIQLILNDDKINILSMLL